MRVATGIIFAFWLVFMLYKFMTTQPVDYDGETTRILSGGLIFVQFIAWAFIFTKPFTTFSILVMVEVLSLLLAITYQPGYSVFAIVNLIFLIMSFAGHKELQKKIIASKKQAKTT
ncbi:hypothetical protein [Paenibacillus sp. TC-CSREp1]|uniref:hypothetical protein n=1 Tax=Paenibacillus sp. TC-CSREp1 TaxID=3410089 RepID=UPI003CFC13A9